MKIPLNIPDEVFPRVARAICARYGYMGDGTNEDKAQFVKVIAGDWLRSVVIDYEQEIAVAQAKANVEQLDIL